MKIPKRKKTARRIYWMNARHERFFRSKKFKDFSRQIEFVNSALLKFGAALGCSPFVGQVLRYKMTREAEEISQRLGLPIDHEQRVPYIAP